MHDAHMLTGVIFGRLADEEFSEADVLSAIEFDSTGNYLATGDKGGRIVVFERAGTSKVGLGVASLPPVHIKIGWCRKKKTRWSCNSRFTQFLLSLFDFMRL